MEMRNLQNVTGKIISISAFIFTTTFFVNCNKPEDIDTYLNELYNDGKLNGNVLIVKNDSVFYENSFGYADAAKTIKLNRYHGFNIGSIYKEMPAVAILKLQEEGKLGLNDKLKMHVPDLPGWSEQITIKSLLQYSSGLPKMKFDEHFGNGITVTEEILMNDLRNVEELEFDPETDYLYTNYSPMLLIRIVENITKQDFQVYAQNNLFTPYGINQIKVNRQYPYLDKELMAVPFNEDFEEDDYSIQVDWILTGYTTSDIHKWFKHLDSFNIISKESMQFLSEEAVRGDNIQAPLGRGDWENGDLRLHLHHGSSASYESLVRHYKQDGIMIILMTNQKHGNVHDIADQLYELSTRS